MSLNIVTQDQIDSTELANLKTVFEDIQARRALSDQQEQDLINNVKTIEQIHNELYPSES